MFHLLSYEAQIMQMCIICIIRSSNVYNLLQNSNVYNIIYVLNTELVNTHEGISEADIAVSGLRTG